MVLTSLDLRIPQYFTQVICHLTRPTSHICIRHSQPHDVSSRCPQASGVLVFSRLTIASEVSILVDVFSHSVSFQIDCCKLLSIFLLFHPEYAGAFMTFCSFRRSREMVRSVCHGAAQLGGAACLNVLVQHAQVVTTPWNGCSLSKFSTFEVKDWLEATPFSEYGSHSKKRHNECWFHPV